MPYHHDYLDLKYPPLKPGETRKRKIAGVTVIQRHDWTKVRHKEIHNALQRYPSPKLYKGEYRKFQNWEELMREAEERAEEQRKAATVVQRKASEAVKTAECGQVYRAAQRREFRAQRLAKRRGDTPCS